MKMNMRYDLRRAMAVVLNDVVVCFVNGDVGQDGPEDAPRNQGKEAAELRGGSTVQVGHFDVVGSWGDENVPTGQGRYVQKGDCRGGGED